MIKSSFVETFLLRFFGDSKQVFEQFDQQIQTFFKQNITILFAIGIFLLISVVYSIYNFVLIKNIAKKISQILIAMLEINKRQLNNLLEKTVRFENHTKSILLENNEVDENDKSFSSDDNNEDFDITIREKTEKIKKIKMTLFEPIRILKRPRK